MRAYITQVIALVTHKDCYIKQVCEITHTDLTIFSPHLNFILRNICNCMFSHTKSTIIYRKLVSVSVLQSLVPTGSRCGTSL